MLRREKWRDGESKDGIRMTITEVNERRKANDGNDGAGDPQED